MRPLSARNHHLVRLGHLARQRRFRASESAFVVDGPTLVAEALDAGLACTEVFVDVARIDDSIGELLGLAETAGAQVFGVESAALRAATDPVTPQAVAAIFSRPDAAPDRLKSAGLVLVLVEVRDPGNAGTLVRGATAAGADMVIATAGTVDLFAPKTVRASAGAVLHIPMIEGATVAEVLANLTKAGLKSVAGVPSGGAPYDRADFAGRVAVLVGNEAHGFDEHTESSVDSLVHIPMPGPTESLNVAMAGTLLCFEVARQRRAGAMQSQLDDDSPATEGSPRHDR